MKIDTLIKELQKVRARSGKNLKVLFADGRDNALEIHYVNVENDTGWEGAPVNPKTKFACLS